MYVHVSGPRLGSRLKPLALLSGGEESSIVVLLRVPPADTAETFQSLSDAPVTEAFAPASSASSTFFISAKAEAMRTKDRNAMTGKKHGRKYFFIRIFISPVRTEPCSAEGDAWSHR
jgi:hypothetical protein